MIFSHLLFPSLVRGADLIGMVLLVGSFVFKTFVAKPAVGENSRLELALSGFLLLIGFFDLVLRSAMMSGQPLADVGGFIPMVIFKSHFGNVWILRTVLLFVIAAATIIKSPGKVNVALFAGVCLLLTASLSGHPADMGSISLAVFADWLHLLSVSAWIAGLFLLASLLKQEMTSRMNDKGSKPHLAFIQRFSKIAGVCVMLLLITGGYQAWRQIGGFAALFVTPYGKMLIVKLILVLPLFGLGALNRYWLLPQLLRRVLAQSVALKQKTVRHLFNSVVLELGLGLGIIAAAALLTQLPPGKSQLASAQAHGASTHVGHGHGGPSQPAAAEGAKVKILLPKEGQVVTGDEIPVQFKFVKGKRGHHIHAYVDGELMGMLETEKGTLTGVQPGHHVLEARVVAEDHVTELAATDKVSFQTK